jgi:prolipoprotein diacylglyceryltransferase
MSGSNKILTVFFGIPVVTTAVFLLLASYYLEYKPESVEYALKIRDGGTAFEGGKIKILSWNIGYAGLGKSSDFFLDGGIVQSRKTLKL